jgi:hypothetical protein
VYFDSKVIWREIVGTLKARFQTIEGEQDETIGLKK